MIEQIDNAFLLHTTHSTYVLRIHEVGKPILEYYGKRLPNGSSVASSFSRPTPTSGRTIVYDAEKHKTASLNDLTLEVSTSWKGDNKIPSIVAKNSTSAVFDFVYVGFEIQKPKRMLGYPAFRGAEEELILHLEEKANKAKVDLHYVVFEKTDVIGRYVEIKNENEDPIIIDKISSLQIDLFNRGYEVVSFYGNWAGEFQMETTRIGHFRYHACSNTGSSSDNRNPFFIVKRNDASHCHGDVYGFNLVYSGNHEESIEMDSFGKIVIQQGISSHFFEAKLACGESFLTPMAIVSYSNEGTNGLSHNMHAFHQECLAPEFWAKKERPILFNNWEGTYFKFTEAKLHDLVKKADKFGMELFVLDDGWFGKRNTDTTSLGDWDINKKKLPHEIKGLSAYVHKKGMKFGLWFEPEAISPDSDLYRAHPEYAMASSLHNPSLGRTQLVLDLTKKEVREFILSFLKETISEGNIDYIKWDYNRTFSDIPSSDGLYCHKYILGLYEILEDLRKTFPELLMENCASGGGRNDLGMLSYFDQCWVSDDTDSFERAKMQANMALGYPQIVMGCHVSAKTNHQMLRKTSFGTKFDVAAMGSLGYELDLGDLDPVYEKEIKSQVAYYKEHRKTLQLGVYDVIETLEDGSNRIIVEVHDDEKALVSYTNFLQTPHPGVETLPLVGLEDAALYSYAVRPETIDLQKFGSLLNMIAPIHIKEEGKLVNGVARHFAYPGEKYEGVASGALLNGNGLKLGPQWAGTGIDNEVRILGDFGARIYCFKKQ